MSDKDELERQRFEAWFKNHYCTPYFCRHAKSGDYENHTIRASWRAWQAALSSKQEEA